MKTKRKYFRICSTQKITGRLSFSRILINRQILNCTTPLKRDDKNVMSSCSLQSFIVFIWSMIYHSKILKFNVCLSIKLCQSTSHYTKNYNHNLIVYCDKKTEEFSLRNIKKPLHNSIKPFS